MNAAIVQIDDNGNAAINFEFSYSAVEEIKSRIPVYARSCEPDRKRWIIQEGPFVSLAIEILQDIYGASNVRIQHGRASA